MNTASKLSFNGSTSDIISDDETISSEKTVEAETKETAISVKQLEAWSFDGRAPGKEAERKDKRAIDPPARHSALSVLNDKFDIEHKGWIYYFGWYVLVSMVNIYFHATLHPFANGGHHLYTLASTNLFVCIFSRTVWFKWLVYLPTLGTKWMPTGVVKGFLNKSAVNHGGIHSCSAGWLCLDWLFLIFKSIADGAGGSWRATLHFFISVVSLVILFLIVLFAMPYRDNPIFHDLFEYSHRYGGWTIAALFTINVFISILSGGDDIYALTDVSLWMTCGSIFLVVYPWLGILKRYNKPVHIFTPSEYVAVVSWSPKPWFSVPGTAGQLAFENAGTREYHSFALLGDMNGNPDVCTMAVAKAGDWTSRLIDEGKAITEAVADVENGNAKYGNSTPNYKLCIGRVAAPGFMYLVRNYKRVVCVGTGAGIAPIASFLPSPPVEMMILWVGRNFKQTYGPLTDLVQSYEHSILVDTKAAPSESNPYSPAFKLAIDKNGQTKREEVFTQLKRPDLPQLAMAAVEMFNADAVFIISGPKPTFEVCHQLWKAGIHAYGATWDS